jgi:hypothetical protein
VCVVGIAFWKFRVCQISSEKRDSSETFVEEKVAGGVAEEKIAVAEEENWSCRGELRRRREEETRDSYFVEEIEKAWSR